MKVIRNGEPNTRKITYTGTCKQCGKQAEVTSFFNGSVMHRMDLQKTYHFAGYSCSLQKETGYSNPACRDKCSLIQKELL
jgi:hypothetical protein